MAAPHRRTLLQSYKDLYSSPIPYPKPVKFRGSALDDLRAFPLSARREAGHQIDQVQHGQEMEKTSKPDLDLATKRYRDLLQEQTP